MTLILPDILSLCFVLVPVPDFHALIFKTNLNIPTVLNVETLKLFRLFQIDSFRFRYQNIVLFNISVLNHKELTKYLYSHP